MEILKNNNAFLRGNICKSTYNSYLLNNLDRFGQETPLDYVKLLPIVNNATLTEVLKVKFAAPSWTERAAFLRYKVDQRGLFTRRCNETTLPHLGIEDNIFAAYGHQVHETGEYLL